MSDRACRSRGCHAAVASVLAQLLQEYEAVLASGEPAKLPLLVVPRNPLGISSDAPPAEVRVVHHRQHVVRRATSVC